MGIERLVAVSAAFVAFLSSLTNVNYTATQYALFSSLMSLPGKVVSGFSGFIVASTDWVTFFLYVALMGLPGIVLAWSRTPLSNTA